MNAPLEIVWDSWNSPRHITQWNQASADWHSPYANVDLSEGGRFVIGMAAKDGSMAFDFSGTYTKVEHLKTLEYVLDDDRKVTINFNATPEGVYIEETFEAEQTHPADFQQAGWQAILNNFKAYTENLR